MFHLHKEGQPLKNGFNYYSMTDSGSRGFVFSFKGPINAYKWWMRYSITTKKWNIYLDKYNHIESQKIIDSWMNEPVK